MGNLPIVGRNLTSFLSELLLALRGYLADLEAERLAALCASRA
jgi:hypothetical protein